MMKTTNQTMYDAAFEKDACGMGFIAQKNGHYSRELVQNALTMLERMNHRGGTGAEPDTGDGAGILMAMPDPFSAAGKEAGIPLPEKTPMLLGCFYRKKSSEQHRSKKK